MSMLKNPVVYVISYLALMLLTYVLPYFGSNSSVLNAAAAAATGGLNPMFWFHLVILMGLCAIAWFRGGHISKKYLVIFPFLALVFDLVPGLSAIPLIPTIMHLLAIVLGVIGVANTSGVKPL